MDSDEKSEFARVNRVMLSKKSDEYRQRRERNNAAVKKSRHKSKQKTLETQRRVEQLKNENLCLERKLESLSREFSLMRDIFVPRDDLARPQCLNDKSTLLSIESCERAGQTTLARSGEIQTLHENFQQQRQWEPKQHEQTNVLNIQMLSRLED